MWWIARWSGWPLALRRMDLELLRPILSSTRRACRRRPWWGSSEPRVLRLQRIGAARIARSCSRKVLLEHHTCPSRPLDSRLTFLPEEVTLYLCFPQSPTCSSEPLFFEKAPQLLPPITSPLRTTLQRSVQLCPHSVAERMFRPDPLLSTMLFGLRVLKTSPQALGLGNRVLVGRSELRLLTRVRLSSRCLHPLFPNKGINCVSHPTGLSSKSTDLRTVLLMFLLGLELDFCQLALSHSEALSRLLELRTHGS